MAIEEYGEKFKLFYDSLPKQAVAFSARRHFSDILTKSQAALDKDGSHYHDCFSGMKDGACNKSVELVIACVKEWYFSLEASRSAFEIYDPTTSTNQLFLLPA